MNEKPLNQFLEVKYDLLVRFPAKIAHEFVIVVLTGIIIMSQASSLYNAEHRNMTPVDHMSHSTSATPAS